MEKLYFASDYQEGTHPEILKRLTETNLESTSGYGTDEYSEHARELVREACEAPNAQVQFLVGGTQVNAVMISAMLRSYEGVVSATTGHVGGHEAGAIEYTGHKVLTIPGVCGKIRAEDLEQYLTDSFADGNLDHMVHPGMVYISQPTEYGTLYSLAELEAIRGICDRFGIRLYLDGARLAYALACRENDVTLPDLARLTDAFYIGGTKCGCLFGEAVVIPDPALIPHFFTIVKQHGALLAKGRIAGLQFETLFAQREGGRLYDRVGEQALAAAERIRAVLKEKGYRFAMENPTNQIFVVMDHAKLERFGAQVEYSFWEKAGENESVIRIATSWATADENVDKLIALL